MLPSYPNFARKSLHKSIFLWFASKLVNNHFPPKSFHWFISIVWQLTYPLQQHPAFSIPYCRSMLLRYGHTKTKQIAEITMCYGLYQYGFGSDGLIFHIFSPLHCLCLFISILDTMWIRPTENTVDIWAIAVSSYLFEWNWDKIYLSCSYGSQQAHTFYTYLCIYYIYIFVAVLRRVCSVCCMVYRR